MMKLLFKQRMFSWFDSYDIYNEFGNIVYEVKGEFSWGHCLKIYDMNGIEVGTVKEKMMTFMPKFEMYFGETYVGSISKEFASRNTRLIIMTGVLKENGWNGIIPSLPQMAIKWRKYQSKYLN